jgi:hypothetical protein
MEAEAEARRQAEGKERREAEHKAAKAAKESGKRPPAKRGIPEGRGPGSKDT